MGHVSQRVNYLSSNMRCWEPEKLTVLNHFDQIVMTWWLGVQNLRLLSGFPVCSGPYHQKKSQRKKNQWCSDRVMGGRGLLLHMNSKGCLVWSNRKAAGAQTASQYWVQGNTEQSRLIHVRATSPHQAGVIRTVYAVSLLQILTAWILIWTQEEKRDTDFIFSSLYNLLILAIPC